MVVLAKLFPQVFAHSLQRLLNLQGVHPSVIKEIIVSNKIALKDVIKLVRDNLSLENFLFSVDILLLLQITFDDFVKEITDSLWGSLCLRLVGLSRDQKYFEILLKHCQSNYGSKTK